MLSHASGPLTPDVIASDVTVIIRTKNCASILNQTLKALFSQTFLSFDLLIVDSGSTDNSLEIARRWSCKIIAIAAKDYFPGKVLNRAIAESSSKIVVFLNSDAVLLIPTALENLLAVFKEEEVQAAFGRQVARPDAKPGVQRDVGSSFPASSPAPPWIPFALPIAAMRKAIWQKRPFYTAAWGSEDTEWGEWARRSGVEVRYVPMACVMHSHNYTLKQLYGRRFIEGEADLFIYNRPSDSLLKMLFKVIKSIGGDLSFQWRSSNFSGLWEIPLMRFVYHWAYLRGHRLGEKRKKNNDLDATIGQREALKRYD